MRQRARKATNPPRPTPPQEPANPSPVSHNAPPVDPLQQQLLQHKRIISTSTEVFDAVTDNNIRIIEVADKCTAEQFDTEQARFLPDWVSNGGVLWANNNLVTSRRTTIIVSKFFRRLSGGAKMCPGRGRPSDPGELSNGGSKRRWRYVVKLVTR